MRSAARATSSGAAPWRLLGPVAGRTATSSASWNRLNGTSTLTGPGRPAVIVDHAWLSARGSMSTRLGWNVRFTAGRMTEGKSAWLWRLSSWNGPRLNCCVGTLAVSARKAEESVSAQIVAMTMFAEPGPQEVRVATGSWRTR